MSIYTVNKDIVLYAAANLTNRCTGFGEEGECQKFEFLNIKRTEYAYL